MIEVLISVGVPVYNGEKYLKESLNSILNQTYQNWECVINDNCSTDETASIAKEFAKQDSRFLYFKNEEFVPAINNWNITFSRINKNSILYKEVAADDWIFPNFLSETANLFKKNASIGICSGCRIDQNRPQLGEGLDFYDSEIINGKQALEKQMLGEYSLIGSLNSVILKVEYLKKLSSYPKIYNESNPNSDTELALDMFAISDVGFVYQLISFTRRHNETGTEKAKRFNYYIHSREINLLKWKSFANSLELEYKQHRIEYAKFFLLQMIRRNTEVLEWHKSRLKSTFHISEWFFGGYSLLISLPNIILRMRRAGKKEVSNNSGW
ncbi:MAG: glycosyltransferase family 2 protein [Cyclobacteriaceae bacterium]